MDFFRAAVGGWKGFQETELYGIGEKKMEGVEFDLALNASADARSEA